MQTFGRLKRLYQLGRINRRDFMQGALALGATVAAASSMASSLAAATPKRGGHLRVAYGHGATSDSLDPATYENDFMIALGLTIDNHLTQIDHRNELVPELAESWEASADAKQWTFKLRPGVEFHNGKTMDAADVIASINHHRGEKSKSAAKPIVDPIVEIRADGDDTVVFTLERGNADFPFLMSDYHLAIRPAKGDGGIMWEEAIGAGAFRLDSFEAGVRASFVRHDAYWREGQPYFDSAELLRIADSTARTNAITTGEVDLIDRVELKTAHLLDRRQGLRVEETSGTAHYSIPMDTRKAPFDDNDLRMALKLSLKRDEILETVLAGHGYLGNDHPIGRPNRYFAEELPQQAYDPDKARHHLKKAGLENVKVPLHASDAAFAGAVDAAVLYKEHAKAAGIEIEVVQEPSDGYWSDVWMTEPWCFSYWGGRPTEDWMFATAYEAGANWNESYWDNERFNELLLEARGELDAQKRAEMYFEMQRLVRNQGGSVIPVFNNYVWAVRDEVQHQESLMSVWAQDGHKWAERWWFAS
jgi:peptide/nickel transport system substrate-binding protein